MESSAVFQMRPLNDPDRIIPIPVVQELAKVIQQDGQFPERYRRDLGNKSKVVDHHQVAGLLPVIDMAILLSGEDKDARQREMQKLSEACKDWGFFQVINHGIPNTWMEKMRKTCRDFFELPIEEKKKCKQALDFQGYGQAFVVSDEQPLDWADMVYFYVLPPHIQKEELWPQTPFEYRGVWTGYATEAQKLALTLIRLMEENLGLDEGEFLEQYCKTWISAIRVNYYPPCPRPDEAIGLSPHSDGVYLTVLLQDGDAPGLQIKKNDDWYLVKPLPGALTVNIGDHLEVMTNGVYKSIEHRAVTNKEKDRMSAATFFLHAPGQHLEPAPKLLDPANPSIYRRIDAEDYFHTYLSKRLEGKKALVDYLTSTRSH